MEGNQHTLGPSNTIKLFGRRVTPGSLLESHAITSSNNVGVTDQNSTCRSETSDIASTSGSVSPLENVFSENAEHVTGEGDGIQGISSDGAPLLCKRKVSEEVSRPVSLDISRNSVRSHPTSNITEFPDNSSRNSGPGNGSSSEENVISLGCPHVQAYASFPRRQQEASHQSLSQMTSIPTLQATDETVVGDGTYITSVNSFSSFGEGSSLLRTGIQYDDDPTVATFLQGMAANVESVSARLLIEAQRVLRFVHENFHHLSSEDLPLQPIVEGLVEGMVGVQDALYNMRSHMGATYAHQDLEEQISDAKTGLSEEDVMTHMMRERYTSAAGTSSVDTMCCICQEDFLDGEEVGRLDCAHNFHTGCITQWLGERNVCPICRQVGLASAHAAE